MAVKEYRFSGVGKTGQPVQGTVFAPHKRGAQRKLDDLSKQHQFRPRSLEERRVFLYKVRHPSGKLISGEQKAYSADEVTIALRKLGLEVVKVEKKLLAFQTKPPRQDMIMFVRLAANLLRDKLPFDEVLNLLVGDVSSRSLRQVIRDLNTDLKGGMDAQQAFMKHQHMLGKFTAYMLGIASKSGNMADIYESTARFLERQQEFKKSVKSSMVTPAITVLVLIATMIWYVWYIFPQTAGLLESLNMELPPMTAKTMAFSRWMDANYMVVFAVTLITGGGFLAWAKSQKGTFLLHKWMIRVPLVGALLHKLNVEIFCRTFAILYSGAGENISVLKVAAEACGNKYMEHQIKTITIPMMVAQGSDLVRAMEASGVFTSMAIARFRSGAETGQVRKSAEQMADYYEKETALKLKTTVESIQTGVAILITFAIIFLTLISSETALIQPSSQDMMNMK